MEHRWGERLQIDVPVRLTSHRYSVRDGRLNDLSVSGASIKTDLAVRVHSRIHVTFELPPAPKSEAAAIGAYVMRMAKDRIGVEWCEFAPEAVRELLRFAARPHSRIRAIDTHQATLVSRLSGPLLKHGA